MLRHVGLDQAASLDRLAARTPSHLAQELESALGGARVGLCQTKIGVDHADQSKAGEMMTLGHELRADHNVDLALLDFAQSFAEIANVRRQVARQEHPARIGEAFGALLGDTLDARPARHERMLGAAFRAGLGHGNELAATMAFESLAEPVLDKPGRAIRTLEFEPAVAADGDRRVTATV